MVLHMISQTLPKTVTDDETRSLQRCLRMSVDVYVGMVEDEMLCAFGLIPPSVLEDSAYLWLYTTPAVDAHRFVFVRQSQLVLAELLEKYPEIVGVTEAGNQRTIQWLKWLGAEFSAQEGRLLRFVIRRKANG